MNDVMLPWPEPRRTAAEKPGAGKPGAPHYELQRVYGNGAAGPVEVVPIIRPPWKAKAGRRGFLGAGTASTAVLALLLTGCENNSYTPSPSDTGNFDSPSEDGDTPYPDDSGYDDTPSPDDTGDDYSPAPSPSPTTQYGGGGYVCTCNKVCTCIPVGA